MKIGAGVVASQRNVAKALVDPRPYLVGEPWLDTFNTYPDIGTLLPAMGYSADQIKDLEATINAADCDVVVIGTPIDLATFSTSTNRTPASPTTSARSAALTHRVLTRFAKDRGFGWLVQQPSRTDISVMVPNSLPASSIGSVFSMVTDSAESR